MRPQSHHIAINYHHFCEYVHKGLADIFTKPLVATKFGAIYYDGRSFIFPWKGSISYWITMSCSVATKKWSHSTKSLEH
jgi:hypothetical protein